MILRPAVLPRPSGAATWVKCAGNPRLASEAPDWSEEDDAIEVREDGTACHWSAHQHVLTGQRVPLDTLAPNSVPITEDMHAAHDMYFAAIREWGVKEAWFELPVVCKRVHEWLQGTLDVGAWCPQRRTIFVGDLKYGFRFVDVLDNWQLLCYAVGLQHKLGIESDLDLWFEFLIVQPRSYHRDGPVRRWRVHASHVRAQINILAGAFEAAIRPDATCTTNPYCGRCDGRHRCPAALENAAIASDVSMDATPHDLPFAAAEAELRRLQRARDALEARITGLDGQVQHGIRNGQASRYYAMEPGNPRRVWKGEQERATIINAGKLLGVETTKQVILTPAQAEKVLPPSLVAANCIKPAGTLKLVPIETTRMMRTIRKNQL